MYTKGSLSGCPVLPIQHGFSQFVAALESIDRLFTDGESYEQKRTYGKFEAGYWDSIS
jgi:hypothetical protein